MENSPQTDLLTDHEITMARAVPKEMPDFMVSTLNDIHYPSSSYPVFRG